MQGNKNLLYDYITRLKLIRHKNIDFCLNSIKTDRVRDVMKGIIFLETLENTSNPQYGDYLETVSEI